MEDSQRRESMGATGWGGAEGAVAMGDRTVLTVLTTIMGDKVMGSQDKALSLEDKVDMEDKVIYTEDKVMGTEGKTVSTEDKVMSTADKVMSTVDKVMSTADKVMSTEDKVMSTEDKVMSTVDKVKCPGGPSRSPGRLLQPSKWRVVHMEARLTSSLSTAEGSLRVRPLTRLDSQRVQEQLLPWVQEARRRCLGG